MSHRIREAMKVVGVVPMGGEGKIVEADETYFGDRDIITKRTKRGKSGHGSKRSIVALVERGGPFGCSMWIKQARCTLKISFVKT